LKVTGDDEKVGRVTLQAIDGAKYYRGAAADCRWELLVLRPLGGRAADKQCHVAATLKYLTAHGRHLESIGRSCAGDRFFLPLNSSASL
jgi:hypothetical protein